MLPEAIQTYIYQNSDEMLQTLAELIAFPSVATPQSKDGYPYGKSCAQALDYMMRQLHVSGMACTNYDYHMGAADWDSALPSHLGILCHLDVVPANAKAWDTNPFQAEIHDGNIYGRGAIDDKGPAVSVLYALKAIRQAGIPLKRNVRFLLGCNEENGSTDLEYYLTKASMPPLVFTPDGSYPIIHLEKGMLRLQFRKTTKDRIVHFQAGIAPNAVPAKAQATMPTDFQPIGTLPPQMERCENSYQFTGISAHASTPEGEENAITGLLAFLSKQDGFTDCTALTKLFPHGCTDGSGLGIACADAESGALTCVCSMLSIENGKLNGCVDIRFPICTTKEQVFDQVCRQFAAYGFQCNALIQSDPHHTPKNSPLVQDLLHVYEAQTGQKGECLAIGGGTYVHDIPGGVAFGMEYPGWDYHMHGENEFIPIEQLLQNTKMMAAAILRICGNSNA